MNDAPSGTGIAPTKHPRDEVIAWFLAGHRDGDIREAIAQRWPDEDAAELAAQAAEHFADAAACDLSILVGWGLEAYRDLYRRMLAIGDFSNAMKAVKELIALSEKHVQQPAEEAEEEPAIAAVESPPPADGAGARRPAQARNAGGQQKRRDPAVRRPRPKRGT